MSNRAAFLSSLAPRVQAVDGLPGVYVRELTVGDVQRNHAADAASEKQRLAMAGCAYLCDEHGGSIFDASNPEDVAAVAGLGWAKLKKVLKAGDELNGQDEKNA